MRRSRSLPAGLAGLLVVLAGSQVVWAQHGAHEHAHAAAAASDADAHASHHAAMSQPSYAVSTQRYTVPDVHLIDAHGASVELGALLESNEPIALNFIFTTCTTICPIMTATFAQMQRKLGDSAERVRLVSISIDPEYDRPEVLAAYAEQFNAGGNWTFLTGDSGDIEGVLRSFDVYAGSKMNHKPVTLLRRADSTAWTRIDGLASGEGLAHEVTARLLN